MGRHDLAKAYDHVFPVIDPTNHPLSIKVLRDRFGEGLGCLMGGVHGFRINIFVSWERKSEEFIVSIVLDL